MIKRNTRSNNGRIANKTIFRNHSPYWKMQLPRVERSVGSIVDHIQADAWLDVHVCDSFSSHLYFYAQLAGPDIIYIWTSFRFIFTRIIFPKDASYTKSEYGGWVIVKYSNYPPWNDKPATVYPQKYAHGFVVLCFVVVMQSFIMNSREVFIHIHQGCFAGTGAIVRLPQCQWSKPDGYGKISQCITTTKHSKAKTVCIFLGIYCIDPHSPGTPFC